MVAINLCPGLEGQVGPVSCVLDGARDQVGFGGTCSVGSEYVP